MSPGELMKMFLVFRVSPQEKLPSDCRSMVKIIWLSNTVIVSTTLSESWVTGWERSNSFSSLRKNTASSINSSSPTSKQPKKMRLIWAPGALWRWTSASSEDPGCKCCSRTTTRTQREERCCIFVWMHMATKRTAVSFILIGEWERWGSSTMNNLMGLEYPLPKSCS